MLPPLTYSGSLYAFAALPQASSSAVGYAGHHPTKQESVGVSYWQAAAGGAEPRFAQGSHDMRDLLSA